MRHQALIGRKIAGRYTIKRHLGEGGMASVFVASRDGAPGDVAVKIMNPDLTADRAFVRRFQREAKAASMVKHPSSVKIFEYGVEANLSYIVMELLVGSDLYQLLELHGALPPVRAARILAEVCDALQAAHDMGIIHRDLKPENIMVITDPAAPYGERVKVLDFGIAKLLEIEEDAGPVDSADGPPSAITRVGQIVGTPAYMSPEQCGMLPVDTRSDIYTCGVLLFQLVTGRLPFEGETPFHTASMHIHQPVPAPSALAPGLDPRLEALILKALAKRPSDRHQTARHLGASLRKLLVDLADAPAANGPISRRQVSERWPRGGPPPSLDATPPATPVVGAPLPGASAQPAPLPAVIVQPPVAPVAPIISGSPAAASPFADDDDSIESANTMVSTAGDVGPPPQVLLRDRASDPGGDDLPTIEQERKAPMAPAWPPASALPGVPTPRVAHDDDVDIEDRAVTLVRPPHDSVPEIGGPAPPRAPREVKSTLRSAEDFGFKPPERRGGEVQIQVGAPPWASDAPAPSAPTELLSQSGAMPAAPPLPAASPIPGAPVPARVLQTVRINQPAGTGVNPAPPREAALPAGATPLPHATAGTVPIPPRPQGALPPTVSDMPQLTGVDVPGGGGLLGGRLGLLIGFMAGMVLTGIVVLVYLYVLR